jgi:hypothetical protein
MCSVLVFASFFSLRSITLLPSHYLKSYFQISHRQRCMLRAGARRSLLKTDVDVVCGAGCNIKRQLRLDYKVLLLSPSLSTPQYPSSPRYCYGIKHIEGLSHMRCRPSVRYQSTQETPRCGFTVLQKSRLQSRLRTRWVFGGRGSMYKPLLLLWDLDFFSCYKINAVIFPSRS